MTLRQFLNVTDGVRDRDLRPAIALALGAEVPNDRQGYARFYHRVLKQLDRLEPTRQSDSKALNPRRLELHSPVFTPSGCITAFR